MQMPRGQIKALAIKSAEAVGLDVSIQNMLMNMSIQRLATEFRWEHLKKVYPDPLALPVETFSLVGGQYLYELPSDYARMQHFKILDGDKWTPIQQKTAQQFARLYSIAPTTIDTARPQFFMIDKQLVPSSADSAVKVQRVRIDRFPDKAYPAEIGYYSMPEWLNIDDEGSYDIAEHPFPDFIMIEAMIYELNNYMNDDKAAMQWQKTEGMIKKFLIQQSDTDVGQDRVELDPNLFDRRPLYL